MANKTKVRIGNGTKVHYYNGCGHFRIGRGFSVLENQDAEVTCADCTGQRNAPNAQTEPATTTVVVTPANLPTLPRGCYFVTVDGIRYTFGIFNNAWTQLKYNEAKEKFQWATKTGIVIPCDPRKSARQTFRDHFGHGES